MAEAAQRGALDGLSSGVVGVDLHHVAEAIGLLGLAGQIEAAVEFPPAVQADLRLVEKDVVALLRQPVALLLRGGLEILGRRAEHALEVLFASQISVPGSLAAGAVVDRAQHFKAGGIVRRLHGFDAGGRARDPHGRVGRDPAGVLGLLDLPAAAHFRDLDDGSPVGGLRLAVRPPRWLRHPAPWETAWSDRRTHGSWPRGRGPQNRCQAVGTTSCRRAPMPACCACSFQVSEASCLNGGAAPSIGCPQG